MKSFRQHISEAGILRKTRVLDAIERKMLKGKVASSQMDKLEKERDWAEEDVEHEQRKRNLRIKRAALRDATGGTAEKYLEDAARLAQSYRDIKKS